jgi:hypothetical protein
VTVADGEAPRDSSADDRASDATSRDDLVTIAVYHTEPEALLARSRLIAAGIDAMVSRDDSGGMYPQFQLVRGLKLRVWKADEAVARELLAPTAQGDAADEE